MEKNQEIKTQTNYTSPSGVEIESKDFVKDLGILMDSNCTFEKQIVAIIEKAKNLISWILRTFYSRSLNCMITLYKSLVIPILEYCSVLWSPNAVGLIQRLEDIQKKDKWHPKQLLGVFKTNKNLLASKAKRTLQNNLCLEGD